MKIPIVFITLYSEYRGGGQSPSHFSYCSSYLLSTSRQNRLASTQRKIVENSQMLRNFGRQKTHRVYLSLKLSEPKGGEE